MPKQKQLTQSPSGSLLELLDVFWRKSSLERMHCAKVAIIEGYDAPGRLCTCRLAVRDAAFTGFDNNGGQYLFEDIPVVFPFAASGYLHIPLAKGDSVLLVALDADTQNWFWDKSNTVPQTEDCHGITSLVAIAGILPRTKGVPDVALPGTEPQLHSNTNLNLTAVVNMIVQAAVINLTATGALNAQGSTATLTATEGIASLVSQTGTVSVTGAGGGLGTALSALIALLITLHPAQTTALNNINAQIRSILT